MRVIEFALILLLTTIGTEASILEIALRTNSAMRIDAYIQLSMAQKVCKLRLINRYI